jgi:hypothetical protein
MRPLNLTDVVAKYTFLLEYTCDPPQARLLPASLYGNMGHFLPWREFADYGS